jgi:hypothetical protein
MGERTMFAVQTKRTRATETSREREFDDVAEFLRCESGVEVASADLVPSADTDHEGAAKGDRADPDPDQRNRARRTGAWEGSARRCS